MATKKIFADSEEKYVKTYIVYADADGDIFYDSAKTKAVPATACLDLFMKGVVALQETTYYTAVSCTTAGVINFGFPDAE